MHTIRSLRLLTLGAALLVGGATVAVAQPTRTPAPGRPRADDVRRAPRAGRPVGEGRAQLRGALLRGIELTTAQRRQLRDIGLKYGDQREDLARSLREKAGIKPGQRPDSAARARVRTELQTANRALMDRQIADFRNVLTAEQRTAFDRNVAQLRERAQTRASQVRDGAGARRDRAFRDRAFRDRGARGRDLDRRPLPGRPFRDRDFRRYE